MAPIYIEVKDGIRLRRALDREDLQKKPKYAELCRRFLADTKDFSEEKLLAAGIHKRFLNQNIETIHKEVTEYIRTLT